MGIKRKRKSEKIYIRKKGLPARRLWRRVDLDGVLPIREGYDPSRSSKCARFCGQFAEHRYPRHSRSSSCSNQTARQN